MSDLARFLLDRLTELEQAASNATDLGDMDQLWHAGMVRADFDAKRRIVEDCADLVTRPDDDPTCDGLAHFVLHQLAQPFRDHPGFDPEWRTQ